MKARGLILSKTDTTLTPSAAKSAMGVNHKCTGAANPKCMGATGKEISAASAAKKHVGGGGSLTWAGLNPNNWHVEVNPKCTGRANPKCMGAKGKEPPLPARRKHTLAGGFL